MDRKLEIRELLRLSPEEIISRAGHKLVVCNDIEALHWRFAEDIAAEIQDNNRRDQRTVLILPVGPVGQYPILANIISERQISLADCHFFFMDEYCDDTGKAVSSNHPLSFKGISHKEFFSRLGPANGLNYENVYFPDIQNCDEIEKLITDFGGVDTCYGGIGIHGHVAFNEPQAGIKHTSPRKVRLSDFTLTINAIRSNVGGNLECFPKDAYTLGMRQILGAKRIRLYCRNGCDFDWANTILRIALFGTPGDDYPVTYIRSTNYTLITDHNTLACPKHFI